MNIETNVATITEMQTQMDKMMDGGLEDVCLDKDPSVLRDVHSYANTVGDIVRGVDVEQMNKEFSPDKKLTISCNSSFHTVEGLNCSIFRFFIRGVESAPFPFMFPVIMDIHEQIYSRFAGDLFNDTTNTPYRWVDAHSQECDGFGCDRVLHRNMDIYVWSRPKSADPRCPSNYAKHELIVCQSCHNDMEGGSWSCNGWVFEESWLEKIYQEKLNEHRMEYGNDEEVR